MSRGSPYFGARGTEQPQSQTYPRRQQQSGSPGLSAALRSPGLSAAGTWLDGQVTVLKRRCSRMGAPTRLIVARGHSIPILDYPSELPEARAGRQASVRPRSRMSHAGSAVGTARTRAVPRQPARMVLRFADLDRSSTCSLPSVGLHRPASRESRLAEAVPAAVGTHGRQRASCTGAVCRVQMPVDAQDRPRD